MDKLMLKRECRYIGGVSRKFWRFEIWEMEELVPRGGSRIVYRTQTQWGRIGTRGQSGPFVYDEDFNLAKWRMNAKFDQKVREGYKAVPTGVVAAELSVRAAARPQPTCSYCGETDHRVSACPAMASDRAVEERDRARAARTPEPMVKRALRSRDDSIVQTRKIRLRD